MRLRIGTLLLGLAVFVAGVVQARAEEPRKHASWTLDTCMDCHTQSERPQLTARVARPCSQLCSTCHKFEKGEHHPIGVQISKQVPAPLLLTAKGMNTCVTCHDMGRPPRESIAWISQSLADRTMHRSKENRTFYLAMRNDSGQLCRNCH